MVDARGGQGLRFRDLTVTRQLGRGMAGDVFEALDPSGARFVVKQFRADHATPLDRRRFAREAGLLSRFVHPNIMPIVGFDADAEPPYFVMPYREGLTLVDRLGRGRPALAYAARIARDICTGLAETHRLGVIHRDVKPANILIDHRGQAVLFDFGLAKDSGREGDASLATGVGTILGTPAYMSPEQARGEPLDDRTDIYSLGVVILEMVLGRNPFATTDIVETLRRHLEVVPRRLDALLPHQVNVELGELVHRMVAKRAHQRPSAASCAETLAAIAQGCDRRVATATRCSARPPQPANVTPEQLALRAITPTHGTRLPTATRTTRARPETRLARPPVPVRPSATPEQLALRAITPTHGTWSPTATRTTRARPEAARPAPAPAPPPLEAVATLRAATPRDGVPLAFELPRQSPARRSWFTDVH